MNKNKRPQAPKVGNRQMVNAMMGKRSSSAASPHKPKTAYDRNDKSWKKDYR